MGLRDYEEMSYKVNPDDPNEKSKLDLIKENQHFLYSFTKYCLKNSYNGIINRHCFKFSRLRDEIYFIQCALTRIDNSTPTNVYTFVVNEKSFWKRFSIYLKDSPGKMLMKGDETTVNILTKLCNNSGLVDKCYLNILGSEKTKLDNFYNDAYSSDQEKLKKLNLVDGALCKFVSFYHYNKHVWLDLLNTNVDDPELVGDENYVNAEFGDYKDSNSEAFYNPNDPNYKDVALLYY